MSFGSLPKLPAICAHARSNACPIALSVSGPKDAPSMSWRALIAYSQPRDRAGLISLPAHDAAIFGLRNAIEPPSKLFQPPAMDNGDATSSMINPSPEIKGIE